MSSTASIRNLMPGEKLTFTNDTGKVLQLVFKTATRASVECTVAIGQSVELSAGQERATVYVLEREKTNEKFQLVSSR